MTSLGLKKDRTGTYQGSSASPECGLSCPSTEGFTVLSYGDGHFRAGSHFLYAVFLFLLEMSPQTFDQGPVSRHFWTVNSVWHFVKLRCSRCLLFFANKYTWVHRTHPPVTLSFCARKTKRGMAVAPNHSIWSSNVQKSAPKGFVVCLVWFLVCSGRSKKDVIF